MAKRQEASTGQIVEDTQTTNDGKPTIHIKVYSPFQSYYDEQAYSLSGVNQTGPFDILPKHHNFLSLLVPCTLVIRSKAGERSIKINRGVMHVKADQIIVFLDV